jgi:RNA polymerase sigma factor (TIGR02999 family)
MQGGAEELTALLQAWSAGDAAAATRLIPLVYDELRRQAARQLRRERPDHTLRPTALVHEAYVRMVGQEKASWQSRTQFFAVAAQVMRRVLVDHARQHAAAKRAGGWQRVTLADQRAGATPPAEVDVLALDQALRELAALDPRREKIVELRFFAGLTLEEAAAALGVSEATVTREWRLARAWLHRRLAPDASGPSSGRQGL